MWLGVAYLFLISLPVGYLLLNITKNPSFSRFRVTAIPVYIAVGMGAYTVLLYLLSFGRFNSLTLAALVGGAWTLFFVQIVLRGWRPRDAAAKFRELPMSIKDPSVLAFVASVAVSWTVISVVLLGSGVTPPPGDPVTHGTHVALLLHGQGFHPTGILIWDDFASAISYYPRGFHTLGAATSLVTGLVPAEAILVSATAAFFLIPTVVYTFVYLSTKRSGLALIGSLIVLIIPNASFSVGTHSVMALYVQGVYPFLFGLLLTTTFLLLGHSEETLSYLRGHLGLIITLAILAIAILLTHYFFIFLVAIYATTRLLIFLIQKIRRPYLHALYLAGALGLYITFAGGLKTLVESFVPISASWIGANWVPIESFAQSPFSIVVFSAVPFAFYGLYRGWSKEFNTTFAIFGGLLIVAMVSEFLYFNYLWFILPIRGLILLIPLSSIILMVNFGHALDQRLKAPELQKASRIHVHPSERPVVYFIALGLVVFIAGLYQSAQPPAWGFPAGEDYEAMLWIQENVPAQDLILNDRSFVGLYVPAFGLKNVVHVRVLRYDMPTYMLDRVNDSAVVFDNPGNRQLLREAIERWDIRYIFISSEDVYFDYWYDERYEFRNLNSDGIMRVLDTNPDLRPVFRRPTSGVYATYLTEEGDQSRPGEVTTLGVLNPVNIVARPSQEDMPNGNMVTREGRVPRTRN